MADKKLELVKGQQTDNPLPPRPAHKTKRVVFVPRADGLIDLLEFGTYYRLTLVKPVAVDLDGRAVGYEPAPDNG